MTQKKFALHCGHSGVLRIVLIAIALTLSGCIYRIDIQQGNLLEEDAIEQVQVGMSRSAVEFLLGTPMVADPFHAGRWDYPYFLKLGRSRDIQRLWVVVYFEDDRVTRIERDLATPPS
jgi:outer membrane protein assembly factor BamE